ncbi:MAG TPA: PAS domain S-box protein [Puia sp.]|uniref:sensor histidine kinase n=1 Tax=Puia sp. TaxID=2045100 RepID=UPI002CC2E1E0|nr:PAS domain S-box protein [Puia sp.]HVU94757.1 PAS domain S-box protein [Puia sp.]
MAKISSKSGLGPAGRTFEAYQSAVNEAAIVSITDVEGKILYVNDKFVEISQYAAEELIGKTHSLINSRWHPKEFFKVMWATILSGKPWRGEIRNRARDGSYYWVDTVIAPVFGENNQIVQFLSIRNLITGQKENEMRLSQMKQELVKREEQLKEAQRVAKTGSWVLHRASQRLEFSDEAYRIFEIPTGAPMSYDRLLARVHPDDRQRVKQCWEEVARSGRCKIEHRIVTGRREKWVSERATGDSRLDGPGDGTIGIVQDITEKKRTDEILRESETLYKSLFNRSPFPQGIVAKESMAFLEVNRAAIRLYGYSRKQFLGLTAFDMRLPEERERIDAQLRLGSYLKDTGIRAHKKKNGELIYVEPHFTEINYKGKPALLITVNNLTEKLKLEEQLLQERVLHQQQINRATLEAQERNRAEIGRELHDNINQLLAASNLYLKHAREGSPCNRELIDKSIEITNQAIAEIRQLSWFLVPPPLKDLNLKESIEGIIAHMAQNNLRIDLVMGIQEDRVPEGLKINIYRIVQELLNNVIKHSGARRVEVKLRQDGDVVRLSINDDGKGFDMHKRRSGVGFTNIEHRAEIYNGSVTIDSSPGHGCRLTIEFLL